MLGTVRGLLIEISDETTINSRDGSKSWQKRFIVIENTYSTGERTIKNQYAIDFFGDKTELLPADLKLGEELEVGVVFGSKPGSGRWFSSINCMGNISFLSRAKTETPVAPPASPINAPVASAPATAKSNDDDDLPF